MSTPEDPANNGTKFRVKSAPTIGENLPSGGDDSQHSTELPRSYGQDLIFLVAQEPHWLFTYWDIDISKHPGGPSYLRVLSGEGKILDEIEVPFETRNWYIPVNTAGAEYCVVIGYYRDGEWKEVAQSALVSTPPDRISDSENFDFATIPLHLSFQKMMGNIQGSLGNRESLLEGLCRLQRDAKLFAGTLAGVHGMSQDEKVLLEALLGPDFLEQLSSLNSQEIHSRIHGALLEKMSSGAASEFLAQFDSSSGESSLLSALSALSSASSASSWESLSSAAREQLSSWSGAESGSWSAAELSSWTAAAMSSWAAAALSSWVLAERAGASWGAESLASWAKGAESSWSEQELMSWLQAAQSSWALQALTSWSGAAFSSWSKGAESSWMGASENVSSFGMHRGFFMHLNAEVIFYGGTDPNAKVTIDGKPIQLSPDGTFHYHFVFPDGKYEIPIVATSPDGVETRQAVLRFERGTDKTGKVDDTGQPPLDAPMGDQS